MGVSYAPFGVDEPPLFVRPQERSVAVRQAGLFDRNGPDSTECTYLLMFFILGIFLLVLVGV